MNGWLRTNNNWSSRVSLADKLYRRVDFRRDLFGISLKNAQVSFQLLGGDQIVISSRWTE